MKRLCAFLTLLLTVAAPAADQPTPAALAAAVLERYASFSVPEKQAAIA